MHCEIACFGDIVDDDNDQIAAPRNFNKPFFILPCIPCLCPRCSTFAVRQSGNVFSLDSQPLNATLRLTTVYFSFFLFYYFIGNGFNCFCPWQGLRPPLLYSYVVHISALSIAFTLHFKWNWIRIMLQRAAHNTRKRCVYCLHFLVFFFLLKYQTYWHRDEWNVANVGTTLGERKKSANLQEKSSKAEWTRQKCVCVCVCKWSQLR